MVDSATAVTRAALARLEGCAGPPVVPKWCRLSQIDRRERRRKNGKRRRRRGRTERRRKERSIFAGLRLIPPPCLGGVSEAS